MNTRIPKNAATGLMVLALTVVTAACGLLSKNGGGATVKVKGTIEVEQPVCGEAAVKAGNQKGKAPIANATYYIKDGGTNDPAVIANKQFITDENGAFTIHLKPGTYAVLHPDKMMSYADFKLKHFPQSNYFKERDDDCFRRWYTSPDFLLMVENDTTVTFLVKSRCYTGGNPCVDYTGPKNP